MEDRTKPVDDQLTLRSHLEDMARLPVWILNLCAQHSFPENLQFAITLCLEESVSNVIRHGYAGATEGPVVVSFTKLSDDDFEFLVEDHAPHFNPLSGPEALPCQGPEETRIGGQGIRLLRRFARALTYEATSMGNRLKITFSASSPPIL
jgi:anti-sigma regulatory factor (Ser/Thr protein kinase)